jgi:hypothetical protein
LPSRNAGRDQLLPRPGGVLSLGISHRTLERGSLLLDAYGRDVLVVVDTVGGACVHKGSGKIGL